MFLQILGMTLMVIGLVAFLVSTGAIFYHLLRTQRNEPDQARLLRPLWSLVGMFTVMLIAGIGILLYVASLSPDQFNAAHDSLITIGDWMVKVSIGAILGLGGARLTMARRNGGGLSTAVK